MKKFLLWVMVGICFLASSQGFASESWEDQYDVKTFGPYEEDNFDEYENHFHYSPDGKGFMFTAIRNKGWVKDGIIVKDGVEIGAIFYPSMYTYPYSLKYAPDGKGFSLASNQKNGIWTIVKDGVELRDDEGNYDNNSIYGPVEYSPDGKSFAFHAEKDGKSIIIKDGVELVTKYQFEHNEGVMSPSYSPDGKSFAFIVLKRDDNGVSAKYFLVKNGVESKKYDDIFSLVYSPDGKSFAFVARKGDKTVIVKDGVEINGDYDLNSPVYSPDGKSFTYTVTRRKNGEVTWLSLVKDGAEINGYSNTANIAYSSDGKSFAFAAERNWKWIIVKDGVVIDKYENANFPSYSPDGKHFMFMASKNGELYIIKDNEEIGLGKYLPVSSWIIHAPNSKGFTLVTKKDGKIFILMYTLKNKNKTSQSKYVLTEKETRAIEMTAKKMNMLSNDKVLKYQFQLSGMLQKITEWTRKYEIIKGLLERMGWTKKEQEVVTTDGSPSPQTTLNSNGPVLVWKTPTSVTLSWKGVTWDGMPNPAAYIVKYSKQSVVNSPDPNAQYTTETDMFTDHRATITWLEPGVTYYFAVAGVDNQGNESDTFSDELSVPLPKKP